MLFVCSVFDKVKNKSIFVTMHDNAADAVREFQRSISNPALASFKNDLVLYHIGTFDPVTLVLTGDDITIIEEGVNVVTEE